MYSDNSMADYTAGLIAGQNGSNRNDGMFGGGWDGIWGIIVLAMIFGWNGNGFGGGWGNSNGGYASTLATQADIQRGFDTSNIISKLDGINNGLCDGFYAVNTSLLNGFHGVDNAICNLGYQTQQGFNQTNIAMMQGQNALQAQLSGCCCDIRSGLKDIQFQNATDTCAIQTSIANVSRDIIDNQNANYRGLMDFMVQSKIDKLQSENQALRLSASQSAQNATLMAAMDANKAEIIRRTGNDCPIPAYVVPNPNCCYGNYGYNSFYGNNGCGCNSGCGC